MLIIETPLGSRIWLHDGLFTVTGPEAALLKKLAAQAVLQAGCAPADGEPDYNAAMLILEQIEGKIVYHRTTDIPGHNDKETG